MADAKATGAANSRDWKRGRLHTLDAIGAGKPEIASAISAYADELNTNRNSQLWLRSIGWIENFLFSLGSQYIDNIMVSRLSRNSTTEEQSIVRDAADNIPKPVNDLLGRYIETNISLLTENKPIPRVGANSGKAEDEDAAELSELTLNYMWEALDIPQKHREIVRLILHCGVCWMEIIYDETRPRRMTVPETQTAEGSVVPGLDGQAGINIPVPREVEMHDERGRPIYTDKQEYGDIAATIVSPFEMHLPAVHWWNGDDMGWVLREFYTSVDLLKDKYKAPGLKLLKKDGWHLDRLDKAGTTNVRNTPVWWWERLTDMVEGSGPSVYVGTPETWDGYTTVRIFDRKPNPTWPRGRTVIIAGDQVIYDSPKKRGARAYDPRWPERWHPYIRYRWEAMPGSINGRSLVSKLLPKLKRVNAIDTTMIMWRRTVPMSAWVVPKGAQPIEDQWLGKPGQIWEYDPRRTAGAAPEPIYPPPYPAAAEQERQQQLSEMEAIAGTEEILRGQRPTGVNSAAMIDILRKQALAARSPILQEWDEALQKEGTIILQEVIKNIRNDDRYAERLRVLARDKVSTLAIRSFSGADLSDNVIVSIDTASMALASKEAKQAKAIELIQYASGLENMPAPLRAKILEEIGYKDAMIPQGVDVSRGKRMMAWIRQEAYEMIVPMPEDDPFILLGMFVDEMKSDGFHNLNEQQQMVLLSLIELYKQQVEFKQEQMMRQQMAMQGGGPPGGGPPGGEEGG
jgi:hypothetical protein